ncbi:hypothetical protein ASE36_16380 [Rhizobium sp. Root274]|uniref:hypothetical protein n=1 Tax=unclassified Rhizobium TaxID=2613769 RepID=UPI000714D761|nr:MULTISPECIES: hypothetical protein [unclassified Rhizobium]KQW28029.1 hypothetical protein ASC71_16415 [Rhizobium sp. Root1240]KRD28313.1 hypothetical protein ASE36_16380 [Rhizobium sp. Root274]
MKMSSILPLVLLTVVTGAAAQMARANDSVYTDLDFDKCQTLAEDQMGVSLKCRGYRGEPVYFKEGDLRQSVFYGWVDKELVDGAFESFSAFNHINTTIEWRLNDAGEPFAAILRWFIDNPGPDGGSTKASRGEILVVSRVGTSDYGGSCMVALVDAKANPDANVKARQMADDTAPDFACGMQEPEWVGKRGDLVSERTFSWPEGYVVE